VNSPTNMHTNENVYWWAYFSYEKLQVHQSTQGGDAFTFFGLWSRWSCLRALTLCGRGQAREIRSHPDGRFSRTYRTRGLAYGAADRGRIYSYLQQFHCVYAGNTEPDGRFSPPYRCGSASLCGWPTVPLIVVVHIHTCNNFIVYWLEILSSTVPLIVVVHIHT